MSVYGFIGAGNMGGAIARALSLTVPLQDILVTNRTISKAEKLCAETGAVLSDHKEICEKSDFIFLGVKPQNMAEMLQSISSFLKERETAPVLITMAAGITMAQLKDMAGVVAPVIRIMPNIPVACGEGMTLYCSDGTSDRQMDQFLGAMSRSGLLCQVPEDSIDAGSSVAGCGPAFVSLFVEALADGGVRCGLKRADAMMMAEQMILGTARYLLDTKTHPAVLKDMVCSPGGTTIEGVTALEDGGFRSLVIDAVTRATEKSIMMKEKNGNK